MKKFMYVTITTCFITMITSIKRNVTFVIPLAMWMAQLKVPRKVLRYMPITDRLQWLYAHEATTKMM
jgi:hypothetical protein